MALQEITMIANINGEPVAEQKRLINLDYVIYARHVHTGGIPTDLVVIHTQRGMIHISLFEFEHLIQHHLVKLYTAWQLPGDWPRSAYAIWVNLKQIVSVEICLRLNAPYQIHFSDGEGCVITAESYARLAGHDGDVE